MKTCQLILLISCIWFVTRKEPTFNLRKIIIIIIERKPSPYLYPCGTKRSQGHNMYGQQYGVFWLIPLHVHLIHVRDIIANHRPRFPWIISRNQASYPQTLRVLGDPSVLKLVLISIQAPVHWGHQVHVMSVDGRPENKIQSKEIESCPLITWKKKCPWKK